MTKTRSMIRWTIRILVVAAALILAAAASIHFVLKSGWLRDTILTRAGERLGLEIDVESFFIGWTGETRVRGIAVRMPLTDEVLLAADSIALTHRCIPMLILTRSAGIRAVEVNDPALVLRRYDNGRWNVQDVRDRLLTGRDSTNRPKGPVSLPRIAITNARVRIVEPNGIIETAGPLSFQGAPQGRLVWRFDLDWPQAVGVKGQVAPGGDWGHEVRFTVGQIGPLVSRLAGADFSAIQAAGCWEGRIAQGQVSGTMQIEKLAVGPVAARGGISLHAQSGGITVRPQDLAFSEPNLAGQTIRLTGGSVAVSDRQIALRQLAIGSERLAARITGDWDLNARTGEFSGSWVAASDGNSPPCSGTYQASVRSPQSGRKAARLSLAADAETPRGDVTVAATLEGDGPEWRQSQWLLALPKLRWSRDDKQVDLAGTTAEIRVTWPEIRLASMHLPNTEAVSAAARLDADSRQWSAHLAVTDMAQLEPWGLGPMDVRLNVEGDDREARISELRATEGERTVTIKGDLTFRERAFQGIRLTADWPTALPAGGQEQARRPVGRWHLEGDVLGRIQPLAVEITGRMTGQNIALGKKTVDCVEVPIRAKADTQVVRITTDTIELLGGRWRLSGRHEVARGLTQLAMTADDLSLEAVATMAGLPLDSHGQAHVDLELAMKGLQAESAVATGSWSAQDVNIPPLRARRAQGGLHIADGLVRFNDILLEQEEGRAEASAEFRLDTPQLVSVELTSTGWPIQLKEYPITAYADGKARLQIDLADHTAEGVADLSGRVLLDGRELSNIRAAATIHERTVDVRESHVEALGGSMEGQATIRLSNWRTSTAALAWKGIQPKRLKPWAPQFERFEGVTSGTLRIAEAPKESRPPEPMRLELNAAIENGRFGSARIDDCDIEGFFGETRVLIDKIDLNVLEGQFKARARASRHASQYYGSLVADFNDLNLDQIVHVFDPNAGEHAGRVSGNATLLASSDWDSFGGEARITLSESDLVNSRIVGVLYNTLNLQLGKQQPTGTGEIAIRLEGGSVVIPSASYFNRGVEVRGAGRIADVTRGADSPVEGFAVASTRVLKGISLPGIRSLDRLLTTFQSGTASAKVEGALGHVKIEVVPLPVVLGSFRNLLWAQLRE